MSLTDDELSKRLAGDKEALRLTKIRIAKSAIPEAGWEVEAQIGDLEYRIATATELLAARKAPAERPVLRVEDAFWINSGAGFTDGNNRSVRALDVVEYGDRHANSWTPRRGIILDATGDGDAWVLFRDTKKVEIVKWMNLCKVPAIDEVSAEREWQLEAMDETLALIRAGMVLGIDGRLPGPLRLVHAESMRARATLDFSPAKLGRWLGWMQAAAVANGAATLDQLKDLNARLSAPPVKETPDAS